MLNDKFIILILVPGLISKLYPQLSYPLDNNNLPPPMSGEVKTETEAEAVSRPISSVWVKVANPELVFWMNELHKS